MMKKITLTLFMIFCALSASVAAQTEIAPEKQAAIKELVVLINGDNKAEELVNVFSAQMQAVFDTTINAELDARDDLTAADKKMLADTLLTDRSAMVKRYTDKMMQKLDYNAMINEISAILYDKYYTLAEINDLITFYKTPTGQKVLKTMTTVAGESMQLTQQRLLPKIPIIIQEIQEENRRDIEQKINARKPKPKKSEGK